jgi:hypothetical protein
MITKVQENTISKCKSFMCQHCWKEQWNLDGRKMENDKLKKKAKSVSLREQIGELMNSKETYMAQQ